MRMGRGGRGGGVAVNIIDGRLSVEAVCTMGLGKGGGKRKTGRTKKERWLAAASSFVRSHLGEEEEEEEEEADTSDKKSGGARKEEEEEKQSRSFSKKGEAVSISFSSSSSSSSFPSALFGGGWMSDDRRSLPSSMPREESPGYLLG